MKKLKRRQFGITKQTTKYAIVLILGGLIFLSINWFFTNYEFQSPIRSKWISPIQENSKPTVLPLEDFSEDSQASEGAVKASPSPTPTKRSFNNTELLAGIYQLESSSGRNDGCRSKGLYNGYGYGQSTFTWNCFGSFEEVTAKVDAWLTKHLQDKTVAQTLCYYNTGLVKDDCPYYQKFLSLK